MIQSRVRHEHRTAELQQNWRLDHLHMTPEMADAIAAIAEPSSTWPLLQDHLHRISVRVGTAFAKAVQYALKDVANVGFYLDVLFNVQCHLFDFHKFRYLHNVTI